MPATCSNTNAIEPTKLKGFQDPVSAWRVLRERTIASRFEALRAASQTPLVGREEEMELLRRRWQQIKDGEGRVVLLAGEPGIGKSRLTAALEDHIKDEAHICLRYFCQPHHQGSALQPILAQLQHAAGFTHDDTAAEKRAKLEKLLAPEAANGAAEVELFAELLGLAAVPSPAADRDPQRQAAPSPHRVDRAAGSPDAARSGADAVRGRALGRSDVARIADADHRAPAIACRSSWSSPFVRTYQPPWTGQPHVTMLTLNRLSQRERATLVDHITGGKELPPGLLDQIVERTDGVPLFVEELTKSVLESEQLHEARRPLRARSAGAGARHPDDAAGLADGAGRPARLGARGFADRRGHRARFFL